MDFKLLADREKAIPVIAEWYSREWGHLGKIGSQEKAKQVLQEYLNRDKLPLMILAMDCDEILGVVQLKYYEMNIYPQKEHWLGGVYVSARHRGKKIAERLINKAIRTAQAHDVEILYLQTQKLDGGLYKRLGWKPVEQVNYRGIKVLVMKKYL